MSWPANDDPPPGHEDDVDRREVWAYLFHNTLKPNGLTKVSQIRAMTDAELLAIKRIGKKSLAHLREACGPHQPQPFEPVPLWESPGR